MINLIPRAPCRALLLSLAFGAFLPSCYENRCEFTATCPPPHDAGTSFVAEGGPTERERAEATVTLTETDRDPTDRTEPSREGDASAGSSDTEPSMSEGNPTPNFPSFIPTLPTLPVSPDLAPGDALDAGAAEGGSAESTGSTGSTESNPFDCIAPDPPAIDEDALDVISASGSPPTPAGGAIQAGRYVPFRVQFYGDQPSTTSTYSFQFEGRFVQAAYQPYPPWVPQIEFAGSYTVVDATLQFDVERCDPQYLTVLPTLEYTATANGLVTFETNTNFDTSEPKSTRVVVSYRRE